MNQQSRQKREGDYSGLQIEKTQQKNATKKPDFIAAMLFAMWVFRF